MERLILNCRRVPTNNGMDQTEELLSELRNWCAQRRGNQALVRKALGVSKQSVSVWVKGGARPGLETGLRLQAFLKSVKPGHKQKRETATQ